METFTKSELAVLRRLKTPQKVQDFLDTLPMNFEKNGETCYSPRAVLERRTAHCMEGAMFAAAALRVHGFPPLVVDLETVQRDDAHVIAVFKTHGHWGAISKTNHATLRWRDPVFKNIRELVMSYFNEYYLANGQKTLRSYSKPVNLSRFDKQGWMTSEKNVWCIPRHLARAPHVKLLKRAQTRTLRKADKMELREFGLVEWEED